MDLKERLGRFLKANGYTQTAVGKAVGVTVPVINAYLRGKYTGNIAALEEKIEAFLNLEENRRLEQKMEISYVRTRSGKRAADIFRLAHIENELVVVIGQAGLGKTSALRDYASRNPDMLLIEADPTFSAKVVLKKLSEKLGCESKGSLNEMMEAVTAKLVGSGRLIAVDEAECLPYRALECLRRIHDMAGVGLALVGMPRLLLNLRGRRGEFKQLFSRAGFKLDLGDELQEDELVEIAGRNLPGADDETVKGLVKAAAGNTRRLVKMLRGVYRLARIAGERPNVEMVKQFEEMLIH
ncbi:AAA family ATPase [Bergeriella denitrificans]|uniref:Phage transposase n=1 Tax=Bergeriella denitrificans TaxID=494 RepID=A0A378UFZ5_BERDE|nr:AAA family ATPase [Bergeriella denitrificans]STZ76308.1 phage transposase [Bergeriella denitrificans]